MSRLVPMTRRAAVATGLAALGVGPAARSQPQSPAATNLCRLYPQATEGPYYFDPKMQRADITEDRTGSPLELIIAVLGEGCAPLAGARVDIWHCDAQGTYSGYDARTQADARGQTFLRGWQSTDARGEVKFRTIFPGWYQGRATHIHLKVILQDNSVLTSQLYFPEDLLDAVYRRLGYGRSGVRDANADDRIFREQGDMAIAQVTSAGEGHIARLSVAIDPAARSAAGGPGLGRRGRGPV